MIGSLIEIVPSEGFVHSMRYAPNVPERSTIASPPGR
jgi:hypothetical protein